MSEKKSSRKNYETLCDIIVNVIPEILRTVLEACHYTLREVFSRLEADKCLPEYQRTLISPLLEPHTKLKSSNVAVPYEDFDLSLILRILDILACSAKLDVATCACIDQIKHIILTLYRKEQSVQQSGLLHVDEVYCKEIIDRLRGVLKNLKKEDHLKQETFVGYDTRDWSRCIGQDEKFFDEFLPRYTENEIGILYSPEDFPRYKHSLEKAKKIPRFLPSTDLVLLPDDSGICLSPVVVVGGCYGDHIGLISEEGAKRQILPVSKDYKCNDRIPDCMVYFLRVDDDPKEELMKVLARLKRGLGEEIASTVLFVIQDNEKEKTTQISEEYGICFATIDCSTRSFKQYVTSALEVKLEGYLESVRQTLEGSGNDLLLRIDAIMKYLVDSSVFLQSKRPPKRFIPDVLRSFISRYKEFILQYGFWLDEFRIFISAIKSAEECATMKHEIDQSLPRSFIWKVKLIRTANLSGKPKPFYGQGDSLGREPPGDRAGGRVSVDEKRATLGAFVKMHVQDHDEIVALTSGHFILPNMTAFAFINDEWKELGTCEYRIEAEKDKGFCELSIIRLNQNFEKQIIKPMLRDMEDSVKTTSLYTGEVNDSIHSNVYKRGASTMWTEGVVVGIQTTIYKDIDHPEQVVVVKSLPSEPGRNEPFACEGDSGSVVFKHGNNAEFDSIEVIAMVNAGESNGGAVLTDAEESAENYVLCTNLRVAFELSEQEGRRLSFINNE